MAIIVLQKLIVRLSIFILDGLNPSLYASLSLSLSLSFAD